MKICKDEYEVIGSGFKALYNFCFLCEVGQQFLLESTDILEFIREAKNSSVASDDVVSRECHRLELALQPEGWRGNVEQTISKEIAEERRTFKIANALETVDSQDEAVKVRKELVLSDAFNGKFFRSVATAQQQLADKSL